MKHIQYSEIENSYRERHIKEIRGNSASQLPWIVTEKIHGANFCFCYDGKNLQCGKRNSLLKDSEKFYNYEVVLEKYKQKIINICSTILKQETAKQVVVHGELFGTGVQKGVFYSDEKEFAAFDISVIRGDEEFYVCFEKFKSICNEFHLPIVPFLMKGTLDEALQFDPVFNSHVPNLVGASYPDDNPAEGVVIKPTASFYLDNGKRAIIKNKNPKFGERAKKTPVVKKELTPEENALINSMREFVTENRLKNVLSKFGEVKQNQFGELLKEFNLDVINDWAKDTDNSVGELDYRLHVKRINKYSTELIREKFLNIIDGNY